MKKADEALSQMSKLVKANTKIVSVLGAREIVLGKFYDAALPHLTAFQRIRVAASFRRGIEEAMSLSDDVALTAEYHSTLLQLTNAVLDALAKDPAV